MFNYKRKGNWLKIVKCLVGYMIFTERVRAPHVITAGDRASYPWPRWQVFYLLLLLSHIVPCSPSHLVVAAAAVEGGRRSVSQVAVAAQPARALGAAAGGQVAGRRRGRGTGSNRQGSATRIKRKSDSSSYRYYTNKTMVISVQRPD